MKFIAIFTLLTIILSFTSTTAESEFVDDGDFIQTTGFRCENEFSKLECNSDKLIIITKVISRRSEINDCTLVDDNNVAQSEFEYDFKDKCNGKQSCLIKIQSYKHIYGLFKSTSDFISNRVNVYYTCIPKSIESSSSNNVKSFSICDDDVISGVNEGFIHSPGYPSYYGNDRNCRIDVKLPSAEHRIIAYLVSLNVEKKGWLSRVPKDYLYSENTFKSYYGREGPQMILFDNRQVTFRFRSDFITSAVLSSPKGFLIYFKILKISPPTTTTTTTTTSTTTTSNAPVVLILEETNEEPIAEKINNVLVDTAAAYIHNPMATDVNSQKQDRSVFLACIIVGLCGLVVVLLTTILLLIRRRQTQQQDPSSDDYSDYSFVDKIRSYYSSKNGKPTTRILEISSPKELNLTKTEIIDEKNKKDDDDLNKTENIYVSSPVDSGVLSVCSLKSAPSNEVIYDTISEHDDMVVVNNKDEHQNIYSTPSNNREISPDEKRIFMEMNNSNVLDTSQNTSTTHLLV